MMGQDEPILKLENVCKSFGGVVAANDVSFEVLEGQIVGLIGPNGAGKTTLMNIISGIYAADSGKIYLSGRDVSDIPSYKRPYMGLGRTFQSPRFLANATIYDNLLLGTDLAENQSYLKSFFSRKSTDFLEDLEEYMRFAGFQMDLKKDITSLTYGQMKILEIVRAMLTHPRILLVDEPAAGLITAEEECVISLLRYAAIEKKIGILLIEHSMDLVMNVCEKIVVVNFGTVIGSGTPEEVSANPKVIEAYLGSADHD